MFFIFTYIWFNELVLNVLHSNHFRFCVGDRFFLCDNKILCEYDYEERMVFANLAYNSSNLAHIKQQASRAGKVSWLCGIMLFARKLEKHFFVNQILPTVVVKLKVNRVILESGVPFVQSNTKDWKWSFKMLPVPFSYSNFKTYVYANQTFLFIPVGTK